MSAIAQELETSTARGARLPGVAVIVPSRDAEATIEATVRGLLDETAGVVTEILVIDDASTDNTREVARRLRADLAPRVRLLCNGAGIGHGASVKRGFAEHAWRAPFLAVVHADAGRDAASGLLDMVAALRLHPLPDVVVDADTPMVLMHREALTRAELDRLADGDLFHPDLRRLLGGKPKLVTREVPRFGRPIASAG